MVVLTDNAIAVIEMLIGDDAGLRLFADPGGAGLRAVVAHVPADGDDVIDAQGVPIYADAEASRRLDGMVLDAAVQERTVTFTAIDRGRRRVRMRRGPRPQFQRWAQAGTWLRSSSAH